MIEEIGPRFNGQITLWNKNRRFAKKMTSDRRREMVNHLSLEAPLYIR